jgi:excisionase family DNA binding protein
MEEFITTTEAALRLKVTPSRVRQLVVSGELPAHKFGPVNMVRISDLELVKGRRGVGRPPKAKAEDATTAKRTTTKASGKKGGKK